jgi:hypothetical protein
MATTIHWFHGYPLGTLFRQSHIRIGDRICGTGGEMGRVMALGIVTLLAGISFSVGSETARAQVACADQAARKPTTPERIAQRDIQEVMDQEVEELGAKDLDALSRRQPPDFTIQLLDGTILNREQAAEGRRRELESVLRIDVDRTFTRIECLTLTGKEATVYTKQQYVRTLADRKDGSPHEVITSARHREKWVYTKDGWIAKRIEEIEQGTTYLDGEPYDPR